MWPFKFKQRQPNPGHGNWTRIHKCPCGHYESNVYILHVDRCCPKCGIQGAFTEVIAREEWDDKMWPPVYIGAPTIISEPSYVNRHWVIKETK
jgi:hypothetical protein